MPSCIAADSSCGFPCPYCRHKGDFICANKFAAIGFESIYAHVKQVLSFPEPCFASFRICKIWDHRAGEPMPPESYRRPIQVMNTQGAFYCILPIQIILMISDFIIALLLIHRDLPEHQMKSCLMQLFNHFLVGSANRRFPNSQSHLLQKALRSAFPYIWHH